MDYLLQSKRLVSAINEIELGKEQRLVKHVSRAGGLLMSLWMRRSNGTSSFFRSGNPVPTILEIIQKEDGWDNIKGGGILMWGMGEDGHDTLKVPAIVRPIIVPTGSISRTQDSAIMNPLIAGGFCNSFSRKI